MRMRVCLFIIASVLLTGCPGSGLWHSMQISATRTEADRNNANLMKVEVGQLRDQFLQVMGPPTKREAYQLPNERSVEFLFYRTTGWSNIYSVDTDAQFTPVAIENGKVVGWGRNYYDRVVRSAVDITVK